MFTIAVIGQKGGSGKTTIAIGLAVAAARTGEAVALIDIDPQANAANWKDRRKDEDNPAVVSAQVSRLRQTLESARQHGADLAIIDTPGKNDSAATDAARSADLVLIPTRPQIFDMETLPAVRDLVRIAGNPPAFVLFNCLHPLGNRVAEEFKGLTLKYADIVSCPIHLCQRASYADAPGDGKAPQEIDPEGKAAAELEQLYKFVKTELRKGKHEQNRDTAQSAKRA